MTRLPVNKFTVNLTITIWGIPVKVEGTVEMLKAAVRG